MVMAKNDVKSLIENASLELIGKRLRVVKYMRVSTQEQAKKQNSIPAQREILDNYIESHSLNCIGEFVDEGVSGTKFNRPALLDLFEFIKENRVDAIIFTKLDRWFRNVEKYYQAKQILDQCGVEWVSVKENYQTVTASGKMVVNIMLSVAQNETDNTSDRITDVFHYKLIHGEAISGAQPFGWTTAYKYPDNENSPKIVVHDPAVEAFIYDLVANTLAVRSVRKAVELTNEKHGTFYKYGRCVHTLKHSFMYGFKDGFDPIKAGRPFYAPPYCTKDEYDEIQGIMEKNTTSRVSEKTYIFNGLTCCPICGKKMAGSLSMHKKKSGKIYRYKIYRCTHGNNEPRKEQRHYGLYSENVLEDKLLSQLKDQFENMQLEATIEEKKQTIKVNREAIVKEMERLNFMFEKNRMSVIEYDTKYTALEEKLKAIPPEPKKKDYSKLQELLEGNVLELYKSFNDDEKKIFWHSIIDSFIYDRKNDKLTINFL